MTAFVAIASGFLGIAVGSFLNVVIWRVPRHESIVTPRSHCPNCDAVLGNRDNVPILSWILLGGKCRACRTAISIRYPAVELGTGLLFGLVGARFAQVWALPAYLVALSALIALSVIDLEHFLLPRRIVNPVTAVVAVLLGIAGILEKDMEASIRSFEAGLAGFAFMWVLHMVYPKGMGFGDVRLSVLLGMMLGWLGWPELMLGFALSFLLGSVIGIALMVFGVKGRKSHIPFGPFLAAGTLSSVLFGAQILDWYLGPGVLRR